MNFYDVFITLQFNPNAEKPLLNICEYLNCENQIDSMKSALQKKPSRSLLLGAFPYDDDTGKIYDVLWKAADAENYTAAEKVGRWFMKMICPPADDEGMAAYHRKARNNNEDEEEIKNDPKPILPEEPKKISVGLPPKQENLEDPLLSKKWDVEDNEPEIVVIDTKKPKTDDIYKRNTKKGD